MGGYEKAEAQNLFAELTDYEKKGVSITINGLVASPLQVVQACVMRENVTYMRDYVLDDKGDLQELCFTDIEIRNIK